MSVSCSPVQQYLTDQSQNEAGQLFRGDIGMTRSEGGWGFIVPDHIVAYTLTCRLVEVIHKKIVSKIKTMTFISNAVFS